MNNIVDTIKKMLGLEPDYNAFDVEIINHINTVIMTLADIGVCKEGFHVDDGTETWEDLLIDQHDLHSVKTYIHLKVRLIFDPPASQSVIDSYNNIAKEIEWRLYSRTGFKEE